MKIKYEDIANRHAVLMAIGDKVYTRKMSLAIARNLTQFEKEIQILQDQRNDIADRYAAKDGSGEFILDGNKYTFANAEAKKAYMDEVKELNDMEIDVDIMTFAAAELDRCEEVERYSMLTPVQEASIAWMIDYE